MQKQKADYTLFLTIITLTIFGLVMLSSATAVISYEKYQHNYHFFFHQLLFGVIPGIFALIVCSKIKYQTWKKYAPFMLGATLLLLIVVFIPGIGIEHGGARRWISLGFTSLQPTEIAKLTFLIYLSTWLVNRQKGIKDFQSGFIPFIVILGIIGFLIMLQPDLGTLSIIIISSIITYYVAGARITHLSLMGIGGIALIWIMIKSAPYRMARFTVFLNPELDPQGIGYQINQALLAIGSGGLLGQGLGKSIQKYNYLPEVAGDSIFAVIAEELGFIRIIFVVILFTVFAIRGYNVAKNAPDPFGKILATGITSWIIFQAIINIAALLSLIPLTGIPLPFISYGGSALLITLASMGILLNISKYSRESS